MAELAVAGRVTPTQIAARTQLTSPPVTALLGRFEVRVGERGDLSVGGLAGPCRTLGTCPRLTPIALVWAAVRVSLEGLSASAYPRSEVLDCER